MSQKWIYKPEPDEDIVDGISSSLGFGTFESKILVLRGIDNYQKAREFFKPNLNDIHNPFLMKDMQVAVDRIATAIENEELAKLTKIPGIGRKTAERLLVELKGKFKGIAQSDFFVEVSHDDIVASNTPDPANEALDALIALGYKPNDAEKMIKKVNKAGATSEQLIREALKNSL